MRTAHKVKVRWLAIALAPMALGGCVGTAIGAAGAVVGGAIGVTGAVVGGAVDLVTTSEEEQLKKDVKAMKKEKKDKKD